MDNPYYFCQDPHQEPLDPNHPDFLASLEVNDSDARRALDAELHRLESKLAPSEKLMKKCSLKKLFKTGLKRSQSLTHEHNNNFCVERSKSFSASSWTSTSPNPKSSAKSAVSHENQRRSWGSPTSVCVQRQRSIQGESFKNSSRLLHFKEFRF